MFGINVIAMAYKTLSGMTVAGGRNRKYPFFELKM
jgi:hypothetical protein